jgi:hypothetical protein
MNKNLCHLNYCPGQNLDLRAPEHEAEELTTLL